MCTPEFMVCTVALILWYLCRELKCKALKAACDRWHLVYWQTTLYFVTLLATYYVMKVSTSSLYFNSLHIHVWQSRVEIEYYSIAYFDSVTMFKVL